MSARSFVLAVLAFIVAPAREASAADGPTPASSAEAGDSLAFRPTAGIVAPISGSAPVDAVMGAGAHVGAQFGWRFGHVPFELTGGFAYSRHFASNLDDVFEPTARPVTSGTPAPRPDVRSGGVGILDVTTDGRYWALPFLFVDAVIGVTATSVVRIRDLDGARTSNPEPTSYRRDIAADTGLVTGAGVGVAVLRLTKGARSPDAPMIIFGVDLRMRIISSGTIVTLPISLGLNL